MRNLGVDDIHIVAKHRWNSRIVGHGAQAHEQLRTLREFSVSPVISDNRRLFKTDAATDHLRITLLIHVDYAPRPSQFFRNGKKRTLQRLVELGDPLAPQQQIDGPFLP